MPVMSEHQKAISVVSLFSPRPPPSPLSSAKKTSAFLVSFHFGQTLWRDEIYAEVVLRVSVLHNT
jgi:hypothetical protein